MLEVPPKAAVEAVEACGRLPLTLSLAGAIIADMPDVSYPTAKNLFTVFAVFAEDALVPVVALDTLLPLLASEDRKASKREIRRWLQQLLKANLLRGSIEGGVSVHDLVRDCMIRRAEAAHEGGLCAMQREGVPLLVDAFEGKNAGAEYVAASLHIHVRGALQPKLAIHMDSLLMR
eukprot:2865186-Prymnesium_polylepis.1